MDHPIDLGARTRVVPTDSNAGTATPFGPAGATGQIVYIAGLLFRNKSSTVTHVVQVLTGTTKVLIEFPVSPSPGAFVLDGRAGRWESDPGEQLHIKFTDGGGAADDVVVSGAVVQK